MSLHLKSIHFKTKPVYHALFWYPDPNHRPPFDRPSFPQYEFHFPQLDRQMGNTNRLDHSWGNYSSWCHPLACREKGSALILLFTRQDTKAQRNFD